MSAAELEDAYPATPLQQGLLFHAALAPHSRAYCVQQSYRLRGPLEPAAFARALAALLARHPILRSGFAQPADGEPRQLVQRVVQAPLTLHDWRGAGPEEQERRLEQRLREDLQAGFELARPPLFRMQLIRLADDVHELVKTFHHLITDGWSSALLMRELAALYAAVLAGREPALAPARPFRAYVEWLRARPLAASEAYFRRALGGLERRAELQLAAPPADAAPGGELPGAHGVCEVSLDPASSARLVQLAREQRLTASTLVQGVWAALLGRYGGEREVRFGVTLAGRPAELEGAESMLGPFINTLPLRVSLPPGRGLFDWLRELQRANLELREHEFVPLAQLAAWSGLGGGQALFDSIVVFENYARPEAPPRPGAAAALSLERRSVADATHYGLTLYAHPGEWLRLRLGFDARRFAREAVAELAREAAERLQRLAALAPAERAGVPLARLLEPAAGERRAAAGARGPARRFERDDLLGALAAAARERPHETALVCGAERASRAQLQARAQRLAARLRALGVGPEQRVGLLLRRGLELPAALLGVWGAGAAFLPLSPELPRRRLEWMVEHARPALVLSSPGLASDAVFACPRIELEPESDELSPEAFAAPPPARPDALAYAIFTSGSSGEPKAVEVAHGSLRSFLGSMRERLAPLPGERWLAVSELSFDISLLELLLPLLGGGSVAIAADADVRDGARLAKLLAEHAPRWLQATPSTWKLLLEAGWAGAPRLRALAGGEALPPALARALRARVAELWNVYGPTETTVWSSASRVEDPAAIGIGGPLANTALYVLDASLQPAPLGVAGELCIGGEGLARGYLRAPARTAERFAPDPWAQRAGARLYRTGDRARWCADGRLEFLGRADAQLKLRGQRLELGELEAALALDPGVQAAAAALGEADGREPALVAFVVPRADCDERALRERLRAQLPAALLPARVERLVALPLTASGKLDRRALARAAAHALADAPAPLALAPARSQGEALLASLWGDVLGVPQVGRDANFFELGGHSLLAMRAAARASRAFGVELGVRALFDHPLLHELAAAIERLRAAQPPQDAAVAAVPVLRRRPPGALAPLSFGQERLWFLQRLEPDSAAYHLAFALLLPAPVDVACAERALAVLVARHGILRTRIRVRDGAPQQELGAAPVLSLPRLHADEGDAERSLAQALDECAAARFELERELPWRAAWLERSDGSGALLLCLHHIAADGASLQILIAELVALLAADLAGRPLALAPLALEFADYAQAQRELAGGARHEAQLAYWRRQLAGLPPRLELPTERPRPEVFRYRGAALGFELPAASAQALRALGRRSDATLFMALLAGFAALLGRLSGQRELALGTPVSGRGAEELEGVLGPFGNTLVLRVALGGNPSFAQLLAAVRASVLDAFANQDVPFERVVAAVNPERTLAHTPLFQAMLALHPGRAAAPPARSEQGDTLPALAYRVVPQRAATSKFDGVLHVEDGPAALRCRLEYNAELFEAPAAARWTEQLCALLQSAAANPQARLSELAWLAPAERAQLCEAGQPRARHELSGDVAAHFEAAARAHPQAPAVRCAGAQLSYAELDARAAALARELRARGVRAEQRVGVCCARSLEWVIAILAVLKAGGCYVPLDPELPPARLQFMLDDSGAQLALAERGAWNPALRCRERLWVEAEAVLPAALGPDGAAPLQRHCSPENLAYVIYTSGSTGVPKGVGISHAQLLRLFAAARSAIPLRAGDRWSVFHSGAFDFSVWELWGALLHGGCAVLVPREHTRDPEAFARLLLAERVTVLSQTPSAFAALARCAPRLGRPQDYALREVVFGGEALDAGALRGWLAHFGDARPALHNLYGITETTVHVTHHRVERAEIEAAAAGGSRIGRPLDDLGVRVLDACGALLPDGVAGELCVTGAGVGRGYLGRPALTAERFAPDPWGAPGSRLYRSGDRGRRRPDGSLDYLGRLDAQVQLRGYRVEPGEVRAALRACPEVADAEVVLRAGGAAAADARLIAYALPAAGCAAHALEAARERVRTQLAQRLPPYMVPAQLVWLERWPLTANGKLDRAALPEPEAACAADAPAQDAARTRLEQLLADIWAAELGAPRIGVHENFFELGGHSLLAVRVMERVRAELGGAWPLAALFQAPTVARLAPLLAARGDGADAPVALNTAEGESVLYCLHPAGGHLDGYRELARELGEAGVPVAGIASRAVLDSGWEDRSIAEMAARYAQGVLRAQAQRGADGRGVALLGWSLGGLLALAVAAELERGGRSVRFLGLIDAPLPGRPATARPPARDGAERCAERLGLPLEELALDAAARAELERRLAAAPDEDGRLELLLELARTRGALSPHVSLEVCRWIRAALERGQRLAAEHRPEPVRADLHVWYATRARGRAHAGAPDWSPWTAGGVRLAAVDATHAAIIRSPLCLHAIRTALGAA